MIEKNVEIDESVATKAPPTPSVREKKPVEEKIGFFDSIRRSRKVKEIVKNNGRLRSALIHVLQDVQQEYNYLPGDILEDISNELDIPISQVYSAAAFYENFHLEPRGKHIVSVCLGTACHVRGAQRVLESIENQLKIKEGETTDDMEFTLERVNCLGACAMGPMVVYDGRYHGNLDTRKAGKIIKS
ncbi:MAG: NAD(P)H-dependent oxidoreductase subunit E [Candidatus Scalindua sediminis]